MDISKFRKIESMEEWKAMVKRNRTRPPKLTNCYLMGQSLEILIEDGRLLLFEENKDGNTVILENRDEFYRCYYFIQEDVSTEELNLDKRAVIEFPYSENMKTLVEKHEPYIEKLGFHLGRKSGRMEALPMNLTLPDTEHIIIEKAEYGDIDRIMEIIRAEFVDLYAFFPEKEELLSKLGKGLLFVHRSDSGEIDGIINGNIEKRSLELSHIAVTEEGRGKNIGPALLKSLIQANLSNVTSMFQWVDMENRHAVNMYRKFGYEFSLRRANEYIMI